jgi:hypothetical protein
MFYIFAGLLIRFIKLTADIKSGAINYLVLYYSVCILVSLIFCISFKNFLISSIGWCCSKTDLFIVFGDWSSFIKETSFVFFPRIFQ